MTAMTGQREQYSENMDLTVIILEMEGFKTGINFLTLEEVY
jgi:hypothetical protein